MNDDRTDDYDTEHDREIERQADALLEKLGRHLIEDQLLGGAQ